MNRKPTDPRKMLKKASKIKKFLSILGPGLITGASDDDPSGIATYSQAGAQFGLSTLWTALVTFPLMAAIQGMCARIGLVTSQGLTVTLKQNYSKPLLYTHVIIQFSRHHPQYRSRHTGNGCRCAHDLPKDSSLRLLRGFYSRADVCHNKISLSTNSHGLKMALSFPVPLHDCPIHG